MKKQLVLLSALSLCFFYSSAQLTYTVVTSGLNTVSFDGGGTELECGDVDGDGDLDLVSIGTHGSPNINATEAGVMVWKNNGTGTNWSFNKTGNFGYGGIALGDVNNDGKLDVGYAQHHNYSGVDFGDQLIEVALGNGTGASWIPYDDGLATNGETYGMYGIDFADINNDGLLDLASNSFGCCAGIHAYKNNGNGTWTQTWGVVGGNSFNMSELGDFDRDGNIDWFTSNQIGNIWKNNGTGGFASFQPGIPQDWTMKFSTGDVNNDGGTDIAVFSIQVATISDLKVYTFNKNANMWQSISTGLPNPATGLRNVKLADMDMDGKMDLLTWYDDSVRIYKGDGTGNWIRYGGFAKPETQLTGWGTGDFNHDGYTDVAVIASGSNTVLKVYLNIHPEPVSLNILPVTPKGFECFAPGSVQFVKWLSSVPAGPNAVVTIEFSSTGTGGPWTGVVTNAPNSGIYQWTVPSMNSANCFLKYTITSGSSTQVVTTSNAFGIGTCSPATGMGESGAVNGTFSVYPNPSAGEFTVSLPVPQAGGLEPTVNALGIFDVYGNLVFQTIVNSTQQTISCTIPSGIYFVEVKTGEKTMNEKIVIVK